MSAGDLIVKSNIKKVVKELDAKNSRTNFGTSDSKGIQGKERSVTSVAEEVAPALERKVENILSEAIKRAKANQRRTLQARDL